MNKLFGIVLCFLMVLFSEYVCAEPIPIKEIKIEGSTVFSSEVIDNLIVPYRKQELDWHELEEIATTITNLYVERGYITSGAFLPEQEIVDGVVTIKIIEGKLTNIKIKGLKRLKKSYINSRLKRVEREIFNINNLRKALGSLQVDPLIENVQAELATGTSESHSLLLLDIEEANLISASLEFNNHASPTIGEYRGIATLAHNNLLGLRDRAFAQLDLSDGFTAYEFNYTLPLNYQGTAISVGYRDGDSLIVEEPFDAANIRARADTLSIGLSQQLVRSLTTESSIRLIFDLSKSETLIFDDEPFSFADGAVDGRSKLSVLRLQGDWRSRSNRDILSFRSRFSLGVDLFSATVNEDAPDGLFFSWLGQAQYAVALDRDLDTVFITRLATQLTPDSLLPFEKFTLGGSATVRGYRRNYSIGDNGVVATVEVAFTVVEDLKLIPFVDLGRVWDTDGNFSQSLTSLGLGIDWQPTDSVLIELDLALPLSDVEDRGDSLSDEGISFSLRWQR